MTFSLSQLNQIEEPLWFCLKAAPKREHLAAEALRRQLQIEAFSPRLRFRKLTQRGQIWYVEAMFPGYLFGRFVFATQHRAAEHSHGIHKILRFGEQIATLDPALVAALKETAGQQEIITIDPEIRVGDEVQITGGPFQGLQALVTRVLPAKERVRVLLEFLGRSVETELPTPVVLATDLRRGL